MHDHTQCKKNGRHAKQNEALSLCKLSGFLSTSIKLIKSKAENVK